MGQVLDLLKDYQLATYVFAFSAFLDPLFAENFSKDKLRDVADRIERESIRYRELYTRCYNSIEESGEGAVESALLSGLSKAGEGLGMRSPRPPSQTSPYRRGARERGQGCGGVSRSASTPACSRGCSSLSRLT